MTEAYRWACADVEGQPGAGLLAPIRATIRRWSGDGSPKAAQAEEHGKVCVLAMLRQLAEELAGDATVASELVRDQAEVLAHVTELGRCDEALDFVGRRFPWALGLAGELAEAYAELAPRYAGVGVLGDGVLETLCLERARASEAMGWVRRETSAGVLSAPDGCLPCEACVTSLSEGQGLPTIWRGTVDQARGMLRGRVAPGSDLMELHIRNAAGEDAYRVEAVVIGGVVAWSNGRFTHGPVHVGAGICRDEIERAAAWVDRTRETSGSEEPQGEVTREEPESGILVNGDGRIICLLEDGRGLGGDFGLQRLFVEELEAGHDAEEQRESLMGLVDDYGVDELEPEDVDDLLKEEGWMPWKPGLLKQLWVESQGLVYANGRPGRGMAEERDRTRGKDL